MLQKFKFETLLSCAGFELLRFGQLKLVALFQLSRVYMNKSCNRNSQLGTFHCNILQENNDNKILANYSISTVRPTVHTYPSRKRNFSKTPFKPEEFENAGFAENILKTEHFENDDVTIITSLPCSSLLKHNDWTTEKNMV